MIDADVSRPWTKTDDGVRLKVRLTPKASRDGIDGTVHLADGTAVLAAHVRAAPEKGSANASLIKLLAKALGVGKTQVEVATGKTARLKTIMIRGDGAALVRALQQLI